MSFHDVQSCVENYFRMCLEQGQSINDITDTFRHDPLPRDLTQCGFGEKDLRRHGQLVSSRYLVQQHEEESRKAPETELAAPRD